MRQILSLFICFSLGTAYSQDPGINFQKTIGGNLIDSQPIILKDSTDGGLFVIATSFSGISGEKTESSRGDSDIWMYKLNASGILQWDKTIGGSGSDGIRGAVIQNNTLYLLSVSESPVSGEKQAPLYGSSDYWLIAMDLSGTILWQQTYGGTGLENRGSLLASSAGNLLIGGSSDSDISGNKTENAKGATDYWIVEVAAANGDIIRQKTIGSAGSDSYGKSAYDFLGNLYVMGTADMGISGDKTENGFGMDIWIVKLNDTWEIEADKCFGGSDSEANLTSDMLFMDSHLFVACSSQSPSDGNKTAPHYGGRDLWLLKITSALDLVWDKSFGGTASDDAVNIIAQPFNKLVLLGTSASPVSGNKTAANIGFRDLWLIITDTEGNEVRQEVYGGTDEDIATCIIGEDNGGLLLAGSSKSGISGNKTENTRGNFDTWILQLNASGYLELDDDHSLSGLKVYPNPCQDRIHVDFSDRSEDALLLLYSVEGRLVQQLSVTAGTICDWEVSGENAAYYYEIVSHLGRSTGMLIKQ
jgi:hypothetical protein